MTMSSDGRAGGGEGRGGESLKGCGKMTIKILLQFQQLFNKFMN